jgi:pyruvate/2-oxoacid:ferredoxin oxidoreductase alpha subunit
VGMHRPVSLWPFPKGRLEELASQVDQIIVFEMSNGQMVDDVRLSVHDSLPVHFHGRMGGNVPTPEECVEVIRRYAAEGGSR